MLGYILIIPVFITTTAILHRVEGHGHMKTPLSRASLWMDPNFPEQPYNCNNHEVWCGDIKQNLNYSQCGRCGDPLGVTPEYNLHGKFGKGFIAQRYRSGSIIEIESEFSAAHYGSIEFELCPEQEENDTCFQGLTIVNGSQEVRDNRICVPFDGAWRIVTARVQLPLGVTCKRCTLRWTYRTSYETFQPDWDPCFNPAPAQTFRQCGDIEIYNLLPCPLNILK